MRSVVLLVENNTLCRLFKILCFKKFAYSCFDVATLNEVVIPAKRPAGSWRMNLIKMPILEL